MAIGQIELQGQITRAQDYSPIKQNEDNKGLVDQANVGNQFTKIVENHVTKVNQKDQTENHNKKFDAKEKGNNEYGGDGGRNRNNNGKASKEPDGKVLLKGVGNFDLFS